ncbi:hypothetical protein GPX89_38110 [Nocardia sp. ET3-3]|uniref:RNA polymerase sigma-70 region 2 domain-containing protein n=1 Tax=Nocardia terrae TaxID=2675851 RepID=A0A7K1V8R9_9NOCA|nr:sigma factor [Nocardia terrae]MVU83040.1 hypothetical protein [Nocardia terrae]
MTQPTDTRPPTREGGVAREDLLHRYAPLAQQLARRFCGRGETYDDLYRVASLGLVFAIERYDPTRDGPFLDVAVPAMVGEIGRYLRTHGLCGRNPQRVSEIQRRLDPTIDSLRERLSRMPTGYEIAAALGVDIAEVVQAMVGRREPPRDRSQP